MAFDSLLNLPAHPLLVHIPVVCIPLASIGAVAIALRPRWRSAYGPIVVVLAAIGAVGAQLATMSGESLQESRRLRTIGDHGDYGELARNLTLVLFALVAVLYAVDRWKAPPRMRRVPTWATLAIAVLAIAGAAGSTGSVVLAGHSGAKLVWKEQTTALGR